MRTHDYKNVTPRLRSVAKMLCDDGLSRKQIAGRLGLSFKTVDKYVEILYALTATHTVAEFCKVYWTSDKIRTAA